MYLYRLFLRERFEPLDDQIHEHGIHLDHEAGTLQLVCSEKFSSASSEQGKDVVSDLGTPADGLVVERHWLLGGMLVRASRHPLNRPHVDHVGELLDHLISSPDLPVQHLVKVGVMRRKVRLSSGAIHARLVYLREGNLGSRVGNAFEPDADATELDSQLRIDVGDHGHIRLVAVVEDMGILVTDCQSVPHRLREERFVLRFRLTVSRRTSIVLGSSDSFLVREINVVDRITIDHVYPRLADHFLNRFDLGRVTAVQAMRSELI